MESIVLICWLVSLLLYQIMCPIFSFFVEFFLFLYVRCDWCAGQRRRESPFEKCCV